jgi:DnaJ like chaperone protein
MGAGKWIGGILGWVAWGPIGALIGYLLGKAVDNYIDGSHQLPGGDGWDRQSGQGQYGQGGYQRQSGQGYGQGSQGGYGQQQSTQSRQRYTADEQRNSFFVSLLVLSSAVIKADGKTDPAELRTVREFIRSNFGEQAAQQAEQILQQLNNQQVNIYSVGDQIASNMNYSQRLQLFQYLVSIATSDGDFSKSEKSVLEAIASSIRLTSTDAASIIAMYYKEADSAYTVLEISPNATDDEVKAAYRRMAMKYHPDRVSTLGPEVQKSAEEKFKQVQDAYATIKKQRGMQ